MANSNTGEKRSEGPVQLMADRLEMNPSRHIVCSRCGTEFSCTRSETCWCAEESVRLSMPREGEDCLCRECLRETAQASRAR